MLPVNDNTIHLEKYRGKVIACPNCPRGNAAKFELLTLGRSCATCLGHGYVAICLNCGGDGVYKGSASAFGGGDVPHNSACNPCGASGYFAVRKPADWKDDASASSAPVAAPPESASVPVPAV